MGSQTQQTNQPTQVYYDPEKGQYFSYKSAETNPAQSMLNQIMGITPTQERMYLNNPYITQDKFTPKYVPAQYPEMNTLFPALNAGLAQNLQQSLLAPTDNTPSSGAGRFIAPSTSKGK